MKIVFTISGDSKAKWDVSPSIPQLTKMVEDGEMNGSIVWAIALIEMLTKMDEMRDMPLKNIEEIQNEAGKPTLGLLKK